MVSFFWNRIRLWWDPVDYITSYVVPRETYMISKRNHYFTGLTTEGQNILTVNWVLDPNNPNCLVFDDYQKAQKVAKQVEGIVKIRGSYETVH